MAESIRKTLLLPIVLFATLVVAISCFATPQRAYAVTIYPHFQLYNEEAGDVITPKEWIFEQKSNYLPYMYTTEFNHNRYTVRVRQGGISGPVVAQWDNQIDNPKANVAGFAILYINFTFDATDWEPGQYYVEKNCSYYSVGQWRESPESPEYDTFEVVGVSKKAGASASGDSKASNSAKTSGTISTKKLTIKHGKAAKIAFSPKKKVTLKKVSGNKKITVTKKGKVKVKKSLKCGKYKIKVKAYMDGKAIASKTIRVIVK